MVQGGADARGGVQISNLQKENVNFQVGFKLFCNTKCQRFMEQCLQSFRKSFYDPRIPYPIKLIHVQERRKYKAEYLCRLPEKLQKESDSSWRQNQDQKAEKREDRRR